MSNLQEDMAAAAAALIAEPEAQEQQGGQQEQVEQQQVEQQQAEQQGGQQQQVEQQQAEQQGGQQEQVEQQPQSNPQLLEALSRRDAENRQLKSSLKQLQDKLNGAKAGDGNQFNVDDLKNDPYGFLQKHGADPDKFLDRYLSTGDYPQEKQEIPNEVSETLKQYKKQIDDLTQRLEKTDFDRFMRNQTTEFEKIAKKDPQRFHYAIKAKGHGSFRRAIQTSYELSKQAGFDVDPEIVLDKVNDVFKNLYNEITGWSPSSNKNTPTVNTPHSQQRQPAPSIDGPSDSSSGKPMTEAEVREAAIKALLGEDDDDNGGLFGKMK